MAFRAEESKEDGLKQVKKYLIPLSLKNKVESEEKLYDIVEKYGPVVNSYPSWHPLVTNHDDRYPCTRPGRDCGYEGLDHTVYFRDAFVTCPYVGGNQIIDSVKEIRKKSNYNIYAEYIDVKFYDEGATPILVYCDWGDAFDLSGMIPAKIAVPLMLEKEIPFHRCSEVAETWETMRPYFLGEPHGSRSSLFVNQDTALTMKKIWNLLINTGMYGPIYVSNQS